ncbi:3-oxoacyl-ACP reductase, partial [Pseudoalteromonas sp. S1649]
MVRVGQDDDIGPMIAQLLVDEIHWVNLQRIKASGGMLL